MRVLHLATFDLQGGAARSAHRLHRSLLGAGLDSRMLVRDRQDDHPTVQGLPPAARLAARARGYLDRAVEALHPRRQPQGVFTTAALPDGLARRVRALAPDVVNLHWVGDGFCRPETLAHLPGPLVWTLHDTYAFTGGCHYPWDCERYAGRCGACPALGSRRQLDASRLGWWRKRRAWRRAALTVVTPSRWMAACARRSSLLGERRIEVIPYALDLELFRPLDRGAARELLRLPQDRRLVLFLAANGVSNPIKGFPLLAEALGRLAASGRAAGLELLVAGTAALPAGLDAGVPARCAGPLRDDLALALHYAAADAVCVPSVQENLSNVVIEALACGRPVVAFDVGGMPDMIQDRVNGALAPLRDAAGLAEALHWVLADEARRQGLGRAARAHAERVHAPPVQAARYRALYQELLAARGPVSG